MPNHVHLIAVPANAEGLARAIGGDNIGGTPDASFSVNNGGGILLFGSHSMTCASVTRSIDPIHRRPGRDSMHNHGNDYYSNHDCPNGHGFRKVRMIDTVGQIVD